MMRRGKTTNAPGSVLIVVLWASVGLVSLALIFGQSMLLNYRGTDNELAARQADQAIEGARRYAMYLMANTEAVGGFPDVTAYRSESVAVAEAFFWFLGRPADASQEAAVRAYGLVDEASKINVNTASPAMLEAMPGMTPEFAAAIIDWRRTPTEEEGEAALSFSSFPAKQAPFESVGELALLEGADPIVLWGEDSNMNGVLDPNEDDGGKTPPMDNGDGKLESGLFEYLTVFSREPNTRSDGTPRADVRNSSEELTAVLEEAFGESRAEEILEQVGDEQRRSVLEFYLRSEMTPEEFDKIEPELTASAGDFRIGLINVNTASEFVLSCVPGLDQETASTIVASRQSRAIKGAGMGWLKGVINEEAAVQAGPFLTGRTYQASADVAAVGRLGRGYRRTRFVIDTSTATPRVVYRRDLSSLGWAIGDAIRAELVSIANP